MAIRQTLISISQLSACRLRRMGVITPAMPHQLSDALILTAIIGPLCFLLYAWLKRREQRRRGREFVQTAAEMQRWQDAQRDAELVHMIEREKWQLEWSQVQQELAANNIQVEDIDGNATDFCWKAIPLVRARINTWDSSYGMSEYRDIIYPHSEWLRGDVVPAGRFALLLQKRLIPEVGRNGERLAEFAAALAGCFSRAH